MAEDARRLMDHLGIPRADVMGYSMGARITAFLALAHPERVRSAIFGGLGGNMVRPMAGTGPIAVALEAASIDEVKNPTARTFRAFAERTGSDLKALAACIRGSRDPITREMVASLTCPVLVATGTEDVIGGQAEELAALIPGAQALPIPRRDHMLAVGDRVYKEGVLAFLQAAAISLAPACTWAAWPSGTQADKKRLPQAARRPSRTNAGECHRSRRQRNAGATYAYATYSVHTHFRAIGP